MGGYAFRTWKINMEIQKDHRHKCTRMLRKVMQAQKYRLFLAWIDFTETSKAQKRAFSHFAGTSLIKYFIGWRNGIVVQQNDVAKLKVATARLFQQATLGAVLKWRNWTVEHIKYKNQIGKSLTMMRNATLWRTFQSWKNHSIHMQLLVEKVRRSIYLFKIIWSLLCFIDEKTNAGGTFGDVL